MNAPFNPPVDNAAAYSEFTVPDIRCAGCISKLENGLTKFPGISSARVNFTAKRVAIEHHQQLSAKDMIGAFLSLGFEAHRIGDALEPDDRQSSKSLVRALAVAGFAMMNIMLLSVSVWSGATGVTRDMFHWLSALIALPAIAYSGQPFFRSAWTALRHRRTNMDVPISIGVLLATALSLYETATSGPHAYFDGAVMLLFFLLTGRYLDSVMRDRARDGVTSLLKNMGTGAMVEDDDGQTRWTDSTELAAGMVMQVAAGERLAADGVITQGNTNIDKALLTGESVPENAGVDDRVYAGTLNIGAPIWVRVTAAGADTTLADIARLMGEAGQGKSRYVRIADRAARFYAPAVHCLALLAFAGWMFAGAGWHQSLLISVAVLIITCPCALGLAVPAAQIVAAGSLMRSGVLVKDGSALERLSEVDTAFFDKTGTLTLGRPAPTNLADIDKACFPILLALAQASRHPLSLALVERLQAEGVSAAKLENLDEQAGFGVIAKMGGVPVSLGRPASGVKAAMASELVIGKDHMLIHFSDELRPDAAKAVEALQESGINSQIISGDSAGAVRPVAAALGLTATVAMKPEEKLHVINRQAEAGRRVLMVGDGLNDGPALAAGHASIAPASASDAGKNAADLVWMGDSLLPVSKAVAAARKTQKIVRQNFALAIGYNIIAVPLALLGMVTPLIAAIAMSGSSLIVVANALRLRGAAR